ncbi:hypothetical protein [Halocalculus aciditolerans]|uniref:DUF8053 domain-containing protein n=1 Tax=Halocalculus aciditolerans TaxID=1383812 RepID=A0A830FLA1_9EURY|nr:hypothetical protein [Halocalculus aciditolerans]GGL57555.1 hypothetical protein GCM10009039_14630 [Halocalculus aciditolerans]
MQQLTVRGSSGMVTIPKDHLRRDGVIDDDFPDDFSQSVVVDRLARGEYLVRLVDDGEVPDLRDSDAVQQAAAQLVFEEDYRGRATAD